MNSPKPLSPIARREIAKVRQMAAIAKQIFDEDGSIIVDRQLLLERLIEPDDAIDKLQLGRAIDSLRSSNEVAIDD